MREIINEKYKYSELTGKIIGCSMEVHKILGNGFQEVIYQRAQEEEFGTRRVDFFVGNAVSLEIKALIKLEDVHLNQAINYLEAYNLEIGMLINFGAKSLEYKRLINAKFDPSRINTSVKSK
jgi:PD-(D/E)XK nuclease superfamily